MTVGQERALRQVMYEHAVEQDREKAKAEAKAMALQGARR